MAHASLADHVVSFPDALPAAVCEALIARFEASAEQETRKRDGGHSFVQLDVSRHWPDQAKLLMQLFLSYFARYRTAVEAEFWPPAFAFENLRIKRYLPDGRDGFPPHVDVMDHAAARRFMTAMIYLNAPAGGETVFPRLGLTVPPETGKLLAFPPIWLFPHAGLPPRGEPKYILHTYLCYPA
jgi:prolyl 4-hydroxylase